ncbi:SDR family oxidoreductase [Rufibacter tibetensis]|uniref:FMN-dependent NADH-azoreductase n=1 Tax=Rufibacter tibetensis TaxID=512763 RepID=A0A0P0C814_9BACT|nr:SDR family oxidoreductase [Rufibacter tibetensis]ALJ01430.1 FMN-dependent NADH-azoreductase [Rufibacter tibetensis]
MSKIILVTGATGTVGSATVKALSALGANVRAGVHSLIKGDNLKRLPGVDLTEINFSRPESLAVAFTGVGTAFLITPFAQDQVEMAQQLVDAAKAAGVKHVVRLSVIGADAEPGIQIGRWHRQAEEYLKSSGLPSTMLRPSGFMQNFTNQYAPTIKENNVFYQPNGEGRAGYIDVRDIGAVAAHVLMNPSEHTGMAYTLTGPQALSGNEVAEIFTRVLGRPINYMDVPEDTARTAMQQQGLPEWMTESLLELGAITRAGYTSGLTSTVKELIGKEPYTFEEFLEAHKHCF